jgi:hypothetical protein
MNNKLKIAENAPLAIGIREPLYFYVAGIFARLGNRSACSSLHGGSCEWIYFKVLPKAERFEPEWRSLISVLKKMPEGASAIVFTSSLPFYRQFKARWDTKSAAVETLVARASSLIAEKNLEVSVSCIPAHKNLALTLLRGGQLSTEFQNRVYSGGQDESHSRRL